MKFIHHAAHILQYDRNWFGLQKFLLARLLGFHDQRWPKEKPLDDLDGTFTVQFLVFAMLNAIAFVKHGMYHSEQDFGVHFRIERRQLTLLDGLPQESIECLCNRSLSKLVLPDLLSRLHIDLEERHQYLIIMANAK